MSGSNSVASDPKEQSVSSLTEMCYMKNINDSKRQIHRNDRTP